jgi:hypothetical protein
MATGTYAAIRKVTSVSAPMPAGRARVCELSLQAVFSGIYQEQQDDYTRSMVPDANRKFTTKFLTRFHFDVRCRRRQQPRRNSALAGPPSIELAHTMSRITLHTHRYFPHLRPNDQLSPELVP